MPFQAASKAIDFLCHVMEDKSDHDKRVALWRESKGEFLCCKTCLTLAKEGPVSSRTRHGIDQASDISCKCFVQPRHGRLLYSSLGLNESESEQLEDAGNLFYLEGIAPKYFVPNSRRDYHFGLSDSDDSSYESSYDGSIMSMDYPAYDDDDEVVFIKVIPPTTITTTTMEVIEVSDSDEEMETGERGLFYESSDEDESNLVKMHQKESIVYLEKKLKEMEENYLKEKEEMLDELELLKIAVEIGFHTD